MPDKQTNLCGLKVLLGVSGGISAYKAVDLASKLTALKAQVQTVMTASACELIRPKSFEAVSGMQVFTSQWSDIEDYKISHIHLVDWADVVVVAPATANIIGKAANGICDDLLSTILCVCWKKPSILAPAMNTNMWENPAVVKNVQTVIQMGFKLAGPEKGRLACGTEGYGRMAEPQVILEEIVKIADKLKK